MRSWHFCHRYRYKAFYAFLVPRLLSPGSNLAITLATMPVKSLPDKWSEVSKRFKNSITSPSRIVIGPLPPQRLQHLAQPLAPEMTCIRRNLHRPVSSSPTMSALPHGTSGLCIGIHVPPFVSAGRRRTSAAADRMHAERHRSPCLPHVPYVLEDVEKHHRRMGLKQPADAAERHIRYNAAILLRSTLGVLHRVCAA